jgi:hypothetical protein
MDMIFVSYIRRQSGRESAAGISAAKDRESLQFLGHHSSKDAAVLSGVRNSTEVFPCQLKGEQPLIGEAPVMGRSP